MDGQSLRGFNNHQAVEVLRSTGQVVNLTLARYLRGPKYDQLQQAMAESGLATSTAPSATTMPTPVVLPSYQPPTASTPSPPPAPCSPPPSLSEELLLSSKAQTVDDEPPPILLPAPSVFLSSDGSSRANVLPSASLQNVDSLDSTLRLSQVPVSKRAIKLSVTYVTLSDL